MNIEKDHLVIHEHRKRSSPLKQTLHQIKVSYKARKLITKGEQTNKDHKSEEEKKNQNLGTIVYCWIGMSRELSMSVQLMTFALSLAPLPEVSQFLRKSLISFFILWSFKLPNNITVYQFKNTTNTNFPTISDMHFLSKKILTQKMSMEISGKYIY